MFCRLLLASIKQRFTRILVILLSLLVGASISIAMAALYFDINSKMSQELRSYGANFYLGSVDGNGFDYKKFQQALQLAPDGLVKAATPYLYTMVRAEQQKISVVGLDFNTVAVVEPYWQLLSGNLIRVSFDDKNAIIGIDLANKLELKVGDKLGLLLAKKSGSVEQTQLKIKGIVETGDATDNMLIVNLALVQRWLEKGSQVHHALALLEGSAIEVEQYANNVKQQFPDLLANPIRKISQAEGQILPKIKGLMGLVSLIILLLSIICVNTALIASVRERKHEFALHKALGASERQVTWLILAEVLFIAILAAALGLVVGYELAQLLGHAVFNSTIDLRWQVVPLALTISIVSSLLAAIIPLQRVMQISPATALKGE